MRATAAIVIAIVIALLVPEPSLPAQRSLVGVYAIEPGLVHPVILETLPGLGRSLDGLDLGLNASVPLAIQLTPGKRSGEYLIQSEPRLGITRLVLPGLINVKLRYDGGRRRPMRFALDADASGTLRLTDQSGSSTRLGRWELTFVDLDHDGALGSTTDGYVLRPPRQHGWVDRSGRLDLRQMTQSTEIDDVKYWFEVDPAGFQLIVTDREPDFSLRRADDYRAALDYLNELRARLGHEPLTLDPELSMACEQHALYCATNGQMTHDEEPDKPGYSKKGAAAGRSSELVPAMSMRTAINEWLHTFYHRIRMLSPDLPTTGMGLVHGTAALDTLSRFGSGAFAPYPWPPDGAADVPAHWTSGEVPSPLGETDFTPEVAARWGYPITLTFPTAAVRGVKATLTCAGRELEVFVSTPERPGNPDVPDNRCSILVMARGPLPSDSDCRVEITGSYAGKPFEKAWTFRTRAN